MTVFRQWLEYKYNSSLTLLRVASRRSCAPAINKASSGPVSTPNFLRVEDLFTAMSSGVSFSTLDLSHVYLQLKESSRQYVTINTHRGLYRYTRLQFVISSRYFSKSHG